MLRQIIIVLHLFFVISDCDFLYKDFVTSYTHDGKIVSFEVYHTKENEKLLNKTNRNNKKLKWYSIGYPIIIESESKLKSENKSLFHFTQNSIYASVQLLTETQKKMIVEEIKLIYNVSVDLQQVNELKLTDFYCNLYFDGDGDGDDESSLFGSVESFKVSPLRIEFEASSNSSDHERFKKYSTHRVDDIEFTCAIKSQKNRFASYNFKLKVELNKLVIHFLKITGAKRLNALCKSI